jgi:hypothetical protein
MRRIWLLCLGVVFAASSTRGAEENARLLRKAVIPGGPRIVVVAEGDFEPRSVGSYSSPKTLDKSGVLAGLLATPKESSGSPSPSAGNRETDVYFCHFGLEPVTKGG